MTWRSLWAVVVGQNPDSEFLEPYAASFIFFLINMTSGIILRSLNKVFSPKWAQEYIADFLATMEACAYFFENNFVYKYYGPLWLGIAIVVQCFICGRTFDGASENPVNAFQRLVTGEIKFPKAMLKIFIQSLAGLASYRFAQLVWSLDLISDHHERYYETECASDLNVTLTFGFLIEMAATLSDNWLGMQTVSRMSLLDELVKYANGAIMIVVGIATTGMYFNPAMASGHTLGCKGTAMLDHFLVYWIGPFVGCLVAIVLNKVLHIDMSDAAQADKKKKLE
ncbi:aquaporin-11-like [Haliotis asinina]|uniref:aquaporin-11-like n=1 Tax=Haliotis asinina TaxID=109174 RepID=UPI0035326330